MCGTLGFTIQFALYLAVGWGAKKRRVVDEHFEKSLGNFLVNFALPCMIIRSLRVSFVWERLLLYGAALLAAVAMLCFCGALGQFCFVRMGKTHTGRAFRFGLLITNFTFMGMPLAETLLGQTGLSFFSLFTVPIRVFYYCAAERLLAPRRTGQALLRVLSQSVLSPPVLGVLTGLLLAVTGTALPGPLEAVLSGLGGICSPLGMILCGMTLTGINPTNLRRPRFLLMPVLRLLVVPACIAALCWRLPLAIVIKQAAVLYAALPCAGMMAVYTVRYEPETEAWRDASVYVALTNLLSVLTIPLWSGLILWMGE